MTTLEDIKRNKMEQLLARQKQQMEEHAQLQQQVEQLESVVKQFLSKEALERYGNLKTAHPEKAIQLAVILAQAVQSGQIKSQIDDEALKSLLKRLTPQKKEFNIRRA